MRWSTAAGVGEVVVAAAASLVAAYVLLQSAGVIGNTYPVRVEFDNAQGVTKGTDVQMAGVKIGDVEDVTLAPDNRALLTLRIKQKYQIPPHAEIRLASTGLLTTPIVAIIPPQQGPVERGVLQGTAPPTLDQLMPQAQRLLTNLTGLTQSLQGILGDRQLIGNLKRSTENLAVVSERGKAIAMNLQETSVSGREIAARFKQTTAHLDRTAALLQQTVGENRARLGQTITAVNDTVVAMKGLVDQVASVVGDPRVKNSLRDTLANVDQTTANLSKLSANLEKLSADRQLNEDLRATVSNTRLTTEEAQKRGRRSSMPP